MTAFILYLASLAGAVGLFLIMRPHRRSTRLVGTILGAGAVAFLMVQVLQSLADDATVPILEVVFGLGSIAGAVRMVTHPRPVFAAIWFVMVVVCSAGMFLLLDAEFMAFSLVIVYAGAILITYLFVLMLARWEILDGLPRQLEETTTEVATRQAMADGRTAPAEVAVIRGDDGRALRLEGGVAKVDAEIDGVRTVVDLPDSALPSNTQEVGWALVAVFPVSLEVAGVILLMAMFGAVVLARRQIDLGEDERRLAAGLGPLLEEEDSDLAGGAS